MNISHDWSGSTRAERRVLRGVLEREATPAAVVYFAKNCDRLGDYWYWFTLGTLWVSYSGRSDLRLWRRLFAARRPNRATSLMKPNELAAWRRLPALVTAYRAHRAGETDWLSYTLSPRIAERFAAERTGSTIAKWRIPAKDAVALFLRRGEQELLVLNWQNAEKEA